MKVAVMQPYIFPYIGYFQMVSTVDKFIFYDDVNFIKKGWVNRNKILVNGQDLLFSIPLEKVSQFTLIKDSLISKSSYSFWRSKFLMTLEQSYSKALNFEKIYNLVSSILNKEHITISELAIDSVISVSSYLNIDTDFIISSKKYLNHGGERAERLIDICRQENASQYINAIGGIDLYNKDEFKKYEIELSFIRPLAIEYKQFKNEFIPWLSIIDLLMFNSPEEIGSYLKRHELI